jgi:general secretion pathway protein J
LRPIGPSSAKNFPAKREETLRAAGRPSGFTLIEVMITLTILGFILLMVFSVFRLGLSAWEKGESAKEKYQTMRVISQMIGRQVKSMVPYRIKTRKSEGPYLAFEGKAQSLKFVSALPLKSRKPQGLVYTIYEFREEGRGAGRLVLYEQRVLNRDFMEEDPKPDTGVSLLGGISAVRFEYYREENPEKNETGGWLDEWNAKEEGELPRAVRLTLVQEKGKEAKEEFPIVILASIPSYRFEEIRMSPIRRVIPYRP